jgi:uncharacterized membrane protein
LDVPQLRTLAALRREFFPVCWRCAGLHLGLSVPGFICGNPPFALAVSFGAVGLAAQRFMLPLMVDGLGNALRAWDSPGWWRALTGLELALACRSCWRR